MFKISECKKDILCVDCHDLECRHVGEIEADCPKWVCDVDVHCDQCEFIKEYQEAMRKKV